jgi:hypothetical protein
MGAATIPLTAAITPIAPGMADASGFATNLREGDAPRLRMDRGASLDILALKIALAIAARAGRLT